MSFTYDLAVIGAGTAGLVSSVVADALGAKVALIEANKVGGECLWTGCVPTKTLIRSARVFDLIQRSEEFGVHIEKPKLVWNAVKLRMADVRDEIRALEREELAKSGVTVINGQARFIDANTLEISGIGETQTLTAKAFIIATGSTSIIPDIEGLEETGYITYVGLLDRPSLPRTLTFIGGGPIACEMAQAFQRFGSKVTILQSAPRLLPKEEPEVSEALETYLRNEGVVIHLNANVTRVTQGESRKVVEFETKAGPQSVESGEIVVATGKKPNWEHLNLEAAGVQATEQGITVDDRLHTSAKHIYACGDVAGRYLFTHNAEYEAKIAAQNAVLPVKAKADYHALPWVTFTDPEVAHLGMTQAEAEAAHGTIKVFQVPFKTLDRAIIEGETTGFARVLTTDSGRIVGVHIIGPSAGELIAAFIPAVREGALLQEFAEAIFPYPTLAEIAHKLGNESYKELLESKVVKTALKFVGPSH